MDRGTSALRGQRRRVARVLRARRPGAQQLAALAAPLGVGTPSTIRRARPDVLSRDRGSDLVVGGVAILRGVVSAHQDKGPGLVNPFYDIETTTRYHFGMLNDPIDETTRGFSYLLQPLLGLAARRDLRDVVERLWAGTSHIQCAESLPQAPWQEFRVRGDDASLRSAYPPSTQSWKELRAAKSSPAEPIARVLQDYPYFLPLFLLVFPHRLREATARYLDSQILTI